MPVTVNETACPAISMPIASPTAKCPRRADARSIMTWPGPAGGCPVLPENVAWNGESAGQLSATPNGAPSGLPSRPSGTALAEIWPSAAATPGTWRTVARTEAGTGCAGLPVIVDPPGVVCVTSTSVPVLAWVNSESRLWVRVALNTRLPDMNATPSAMARPVSTRRSRCVSMPRNKTPNMAPHSPRFFIASSTDSGDGWSSPPAMRPSARNTTRSA